MSKQSHDWKTVSLAQLVADPNDDIVDGPFGSRLKASEYVDSGVPIVRLQNIDRNRFVDKNIKFVTPQKAAEIARHHFVAGDILISKLGDPLGEACIAPDSITYGILVADVVRVRPKKSKVDTSFLTYALNSTSVVAQFEAETKGTTRPRVNLRKIRDLEIPIVESLNEQRRIVAEIEKQFTRLEAGVAGLRRVQASLKRYRAAVLKAACEGKLVLTEAELTRKEGRTYETGAELLVRILTERRQKWTGRGKYKEPATLETANLPPVPEGWTSGTIEQITDIVYRYPTFFGMEHLSEGVPVIRGEHLLAGNRISIDWTDYWFVAPDVSSKFPKTVVETGDIVMSVRGSVGKLGIVSDELAGAQVSPNCIRIALAHPFVLSKWFVIVFGSSAGVSRVKEDVNQTTIETIKATVFIRTPIPLPPLAEQERIVAEVERRLSVVEELEAVVAANLQRAMRLRQAVLQRAFSGTLSQ